MDWLIKIREKNDFSQQECADNLGISQQAYSHYENGRRKVSPEMAKKIAEILRFESFGIDWTKFYDTPQSSASDADAV